jgi:TPR repeat protein
VPKSKSVIQAEALALKSNLDAMELLARRFFDGLGVEQCYLMSYVWSSIATDHGVKHLGSLSHFCFKKMNHTQQSSAQQHIDTIKGTLVANVT